MQSSSRLRVIAIIFWVLAFLAFPLWMVFDHAGWDLAIYHNAVVALKAGHDPYVDAMAIQNAFHRTLAQHPNATPPFSYVYSPMTLPLLRLLGAFPIWISGTAYWLVLVASILSVLWVTTRAQRNSERTFISLIAPLALFCPGLLAQDTILSGNVAFILYALVLLGATYGWRRGVWRWCYLAILIASCFKAPLLSLLAIPLFSARRQWLPACVTAGLGILLFALQPLVWPSLFHHFLQAVELQFSYNHDFGSSPAGVFSNILVHHGISYSPASEVFYLSYAAVVFGMLLHLSQKFLRGDFTFEQWMPVLLIGSILLNPRIMEYDAAPLVIPMALIGWRFFNRSHPTARSVIAYLCFFLAANTFAICLPGTWKPTECFVLVACFAAGCWDLSRRSRVAPLSASQTSLSNGVEAERLVPVNS